MARVLRSLRHQLLLSLLLPNLDGRCPLVKQGIRHLEIAAITYFVRQLIVAQVLLRDVFAVLAAATANGKATPATVVPPPLGWLHPHEGAQAESAVVFVLFIFRPVVFVEGLKGIW